MAERYVAVMVNGVATQMSAADSVLIPGRETIVVQNGYCDIVVKTQTSTMANSPGAIADGYLGNILAVNAVGYTHNAYDANRGWYPSYYSKHDIPNGAGGGDSTGGFQGVGLIHSVNCAGRSQDLAAVMHAVVMNGQSAGQACETTSFGYAQSVGWPAQGLGNYYASVVEGTQTAHKVGYNSRGLRGWWHLLYVSDVVAAAGGPNPTNPNSGYSFIEALNGGDGNGNYASGYSNYIANRFLGCAGKWDRVFGVDPNFTSFPLTISQCGFDLFTNVNYTSDAIPAIKLKNRNGIDFNGNYPGQNVIASSTGQNMLYFKAGNADMMYMYANATYMNFAGTMRLLSRDANGFVKAA